MEFGPEIKVDGKRPEWFTQSDAMNARLKVFGCKERAVSPNADPVAKWGWDSVEYIRLPANHPHYNLITHTYTVRPEDEAALLASDPLSRSTPDERAVPPELVARLVAVVKEQVEYHKDVTDPGPSLVEARAIVAALEPVDPMLIEARQVVAGLYEGQGVTHLREQALSGDGDEWFHTKVARAALARGRKLEKEGK